VYALGINCVPGTFITSNSGCQKCPSGTFSDKSNSTKCSPCDRCIGNHNEVIKSCTSSSNTKCACEPGYYYNTDLTFCLKCTQCKKGRGVVRNCTATSNTKCEPCVKVRDEEFFCVSDEHDISPYLVNACNYSENKPNRPCVFPVFMQYSSLQLRGLASDLTNIAGNISLGAGIKAEDGAEPCALYFWA